MDNTNDYCDEEFEWDSGKSFSNLTKHGISFDLARRAFEDPNIVTFNSYFEGGELRYDAIGKVSDLSYMRVTFTMRVCDGVERIRIISARKADRRERRIYDEKVYR
jgi:hypothetical protein